MKSGWQRCELEAVGIFVFGVEEQSGGIRGLRHWGNKWRRDPLCGYRAIELALNPQPTDVTLNRWMSGFNCRVEIF